MQGGVDQVMVGRELAYRIRPRGIPGQRERLWRFISARAESGTGVVFSTHAVEEARRHAARVLVLDEGALLFDDSPQVLIARAGEAAGGDFERAFLWLLEDGSRA